MSEDCNALQQMPIWPLNFTHIPKIKTLHMNRNPRFDDH